MRDQLTQRVPMGSVIKVHCLYDRPFWRDHGLSGQATSDTGPVGTTFDNSPHDGRCGVLVGFIEGDEARRWGRRPLDDRYAAVVTDLVRYFGPEAAAPRAYTERSWAEEEYTRGCYAGYMPPGVWTAYGEDLRRPVGRLHWAGTETATVWNGYMDGAVSAGERAAGEVLAALDQGDPVEATPSTLALLPS
jgi:monoamine oxidase